MPQRMMTMLTVALGVLGVAVLGVCLLLRVDVHRAAVTGPRWRRRLITAALLLLGAAGTASGQTSRPASGPSCYMRFEVPPRAATQPESRPDNGGTCYYSASPTSRPVVRNLASRPEWKQVCAAWRAAMPIVNGSRGDYPFDGEDKRDLLEALGHAHGSVKRLLAIGAVTAAEAQLLTADLKALEMGVSNFRPKGQEEMTCYLVGPWRIPASRAKALRGRLDLLEALDTEAYLRPAVVARTLATLEREAAMLDEALLTDLSPEEKAAAGTVREAAREKARAIRAGLPGTPVEASPQWKTISEALTFAGRLAQTGKSTEAQRKQVDAKLAAAKTAADALAAGGLLSPAEAGLLAAEADRIKERIERDPPTDYTGTCYQAVDISPARDSLTRLTERLPLLQSLAGSGKVHAAVLARIVPAIEADLATLADSRQTRELSIPEQARLADVRKQAAADLVKLKKMMAEAK